MARGYKLSPHLYLIHMDYNPSQSSSEEIFLTFVVGQICNGLQI